MLWMTSRVSGSIRIGPRGLSGLLQFVRMFTAALGLEVAVLLRE